MMGTRAKSLLGILAAALLAAVAVAVRESGAVAVVHFAQDDPQRLSIQFDRPAGRVRAVWFDTVPEALGRDAAPAGEVPAAAEGLAVALSLDEAEREGEYSIVVSIERPICAGPMSRAAVALTTLCDRPDHMEIVRQPARWLAATFGFERPAGYSILGRRTVAVGSGEPAAVAPLTFVGRPDLDTSGIDVSDLPPAVRAHPELGAAAALIRSIWSDALAGGPSSLPYAEYLGLPFDDKLAKLRNGEFPAMCQAVRDLFLHATSAIPAVRARGVEAFNYAPQFPDLISYGHSTAEVWVTGLEKWVMVDPWIGVVAVSADGVPMSAAEMVGTDDRLELAPLLARITRFATAADGSVIRSVVIPGEVSLDRYVYSPIGHMPGFGAYFRSLVYRDWSVSDGSGGDDASEAGRPSG